MHGDVLVIVLLLVVGCAAFFFGVIYVVCQLFVWLGRSVWAVFRPHHGGNGRAHSHPMTRPRVCPNERCRKVEYRMARYCGQCGTPLKAPTQPTCCNAP